jgi:hypothetical protein
MTVRATASAMSRRQLAKRPGARFVAFLVSVLS